MGRSHGRTIQAEENYVCMRPRVSELHGGQRTKVHILDDLGSWPFLRKDGNIGNDTP